MNRYLDRNILLVVLKPGCKFDIMPGLVGDVVMNVRRRICKWIRVCKFDRGPHWQFQRLYRWAVTCFHFTEQTLSTLMPCNLRSIGLLVCPHIPAFDPLMLLFSLQDRILPTI